MLPILRRNIHAKILAEDIAKRLNEIKEILPTRSDSPIRSKLNKMKSDISEVISSIDTNIGILMVDIDVELTKDFEGPIEIDGQVRVNEL